MSWKLTSADLEPRKKVSIINKLQQLRHLVFTKKVNPLLRSIVKSPDTLQKVISLKLVQLT